MDGTEVCKLELPLQDQAGASLCGPVPVDTPCPVLLPHPYLSPGGASFTNHLA